MSDLMEKRLSHYSNTQERVSPKVATKKSATLTKYTKDENVENKFLYDVITTVG